MSRFTKAAWRYRCLLVFLLIGLTSYISSYVWFYSRGVAEMKQLGGKCFFFDTSENILKTRGLTTQHTMLATLFHPLQWMNANWLGGTSVCLGITFGYRPTN